MKLNPEEIALLCDALDCRIDDVQNIIAITDAEDYAHQAHKEILSQYLKLQKRMEKKREATQ